MISELEVNKDDVISEREFLRLIRGFVLFLSFLHRSQLKNLLQAIMTSRTTLTVINALAAQPNTDSAKGLVVLAFLRQPVRTWG